MASFLHGWRRFAATIIPILTLVLLCLAAPPRGAARDLTFYDLNVYSNYAGAIAPNALQLVCSVRQDLLMAHFSNHRIPFDPGVLRRLDDQNCHIIYEPSITGFRAHPESEAIRGAYVDIPHMRLLAMPGAPLGDSLDIIKAVLAQAPQPLDVSLGVAMTLPRNYLDRALAGHFPGTRHRLRLRANPETQVNSWSQDFIKSGDVRKGSRLLTPRRIFEGDRANGAPFKSLLDALTSKTTSRSKLSWEGGDLLFVRDPRNPKRLLLLYGDAARPYWADKLTEEEYAYVLRVEFGADEALYFGAVAPHVDYVVSFLPEHGIALVGQPVTGNLELARAAGRILSVTFSNPVPPVVREIGTLLAGSDALHGGAGRLRELIAQARQENGTWAMAVDGAAYQRIQSHIDVHCPEDPVLCVGPAQLPALLAGKPELVSNWVQMAASLRVAEFLPAAMLSVIEDQLPGETLEKEKRLLEKVRTLEKLGFRVIRIPWIGGEMMGAQPWAGVSYANMVLLEQRLFVPVFGFGPEEQRLVEGIEPKLPAGYRVIPIYARSALLQNGGVHCVMGLVRGDGIF